MFTYITWNKMEVIIIFFFKKRMFLEKTLMFSPEAAVAFVGVEAAAWIRAWGGIRMVARGGLLDSSKEKVRHIWEPILNSVYETTFIGNNKVH